jgi:hypothetical protein
MADPKQKEEEARQREKDDEVLRRDHRPLGPSSSFRNARGMFPGGRMYGEDDSVVGYFAGHTKRIAKASFRWLRIFFKKRPPHPGGSESPNEYRDYDPED